MWPKTLPRYNVRVERMAETVPDDVREEIVSFVRVYDFPYVTTVADKAALRATYVSYFENRRTFEWLKGELARLASKPSAVGAIAVTETDRLHTWGLGQVLLKKGKFTCTTIHPDGALEPPDDACALNLEGKVLDVAEVVRNTFPRERDDLDRKDVPMVPQHIYCRHVLAPPP
jgi:hypothetical protein